MIAPSTMMARVRRTYAAFDPQFWVLFVGALINSIGFSLIFPFLTLYLTERLGLALTTVGGLITMNAAAGVVAQAMGGSLADRLGRKVMMVVSMLGASFVIAALGMAQAFLAVAVLVLLDGFISSLFQPASQAMIADLVGPGRRSEAFGLLRVAHNLGVVIGPSLGGFIATRSYPALFMAAAISGLIYSIILVLRTRETKPEGLAIESDEPDLLRDEGYRQVLRDRGLLVFCVAMALTTAVYSQTWTIFPVYLKGLYGIPENRYGFLMALNAAMVVTMQFAITRGTSRYPRAEMMALGAFLYALGVGSIGWSDAYWRFALNVVILTLGEMVLIPTGAAFVADLAPAHLRGRYMGAQGLAFGVGFGVGPLLGGVLADRLGATQAWPVMLVLGLVSTAGFLGLRRAGSAKQDVGPE